MKYHVVGGGLNVREELPGMAIQYQDEQPEDSEVLTLYREAMLGQEGGDKRSEDATTCNNITGGNVVTGTAKSYTLSRLKRESPELFTAVCNKELSANAAAIKAGFRSKTISIPVDKPEAAAKAIVRHMSDDALDELQTVIKQARATEPPASQAVQS